MLAALARALRLTSDERNHLYHLDGRPVPPSDSPAGHGHPGMLDLLDRLTTTPAQVITDLHVTLVQNRLAVALLGPAPATTGIEAGLVYRWFADRSTRSICRSRTTRTTPGPSSPTCAPPSPGAAETIGTPLASWPNYGVSARN